MSRCYNGTEQQKSKDILLKTFVTFCEKIKLVLKLRWHLIQLLDQLSKYKMPSLSYGRQNLHVQTEFTWWWNKLDYVGIHTAKEQATYAIRPLSHDYKDIVGLCI